MNRPSQIAHADWGVAPKKRWRANAALNEDGRYIAYGPDMVGTSGAFIDRMGIETGETGLVGFDFPIGLPRRFAERAGITLFKSALLAFGAPPWDRFFDVADDPAHISIHRPFYPLSSGAKGQHTRRAQLDALALGVEDLLRRCEKAHDGLRAACSLFWTIGGQQVGKGALSGWREMIIPALADPAIDVALWPFDGTLEDLIERRGVVIVETYPAAFYAPLSVAFGKAKDEKGRFGKTRRTDRLAQAPALLSFAESLNVRLASGLRENIEDGFGDRSDGEDRFDAVVGLLGLLAIVLGMIPDATPYDDPEILSVEGWIVGRRS